MPQITGTSQYLSSLIHIVNEEIPLLDYDITNASTIFTQQECLKKLSKIVLYMLHHSIIAAGGSPDPVQHAPQAPVVQPVYQRPPNQNLPKFPTTGIQNPSPEPMMPGPSAVAEVIMTPSGTRIIPPGGNGPAMNLPQGVAADATFGQGRRPASGTTLPPVNADGTPNIIVHPELTDEARAALAAAGVQT